MLELLFRFFSLTRCFACEENKPLVEKLVYLPDVASIFETVLNKDEALEGALSDKERVRLTELTSKGG